MHAVPALSSTHPVSYSSAKARAQKLINDFNASPISRSSYYPKLSKQDIIDELRWTLKNSTGILAQRRSSLCGPAAFFFALTKVRPDIYVQLVVDLYTKGQTQLKNLKLKSSAKARLYQPIEMRNSDWLLLSSIKPGYDNPSDQLAGITFPGTLKDWFKKAGFTTVVDHTNLAFNKGLDTLLQAQNDYRSGYTICFFVDANVFKRIINKTSRSPYPNHWVVMTSDIKLRLFDEKTNTLALPVIINPSIIKTVKRQMSDKHDQAILDNDLNKTLETHDRILLNAFSWGDEYTPVRSKISATQDARLSYFLNGFYGYIKVKR